MSDRTQKNVYENVAESTIIDKGGEEQARLLDKMLHVAKESENDCQDFPIAALRMAADHGEFAFRSPHQPMQICGLGRYACGKATGCKPPTVVEALGIGFDYKREEAFAQSG